MLIVYDFEVFEKDWLVVFTELTTGFSYEFVNDHDALKEFYEKNKENLFIGFNNKRYDDYIFKGILLGAEPVVKFLSSISTAFCPLSITTWNIPFFSSIKLT